MLASSRCLVAARRSPPPRAMSFLLSLSLSLSLLLLLCPPVLCSSASSARSSPAPNPPQLLSGWDASLRCPAPLGRDDAKRDATSACWWLEWLPMYAASLQPPAQGTPRMAGNWSAAVSARMLALQSQLGLADSCDALPLVYPISAFPDSPVKGRKQDYVGGVLSFALYVDAVRGSDQSNGSDPSQPLQTLHAALAASRRRPLPSHATIFLRSGRHYLPSTLRVDSRADDGLIITAYPGEDAVVMGGAPMNATWRKTGVAGVWSAAIPASIDCSPSAFNELFVDGVRWSPARWPDGDAFDGATVGNSWSVGAFAFRGQSNYSTARTVTREDVRQTLAFRSYRVGYNGSAAPFADQLNYWAAANPEGGAGATRTLPRQVVYGAALRARVNRWVNATNTVVHSLQRFGWGSWQFRLAALNKWTSTMELGEGGFQEARGCSANCNFDGTGYFQYQFAELDRDREFYVDWPNRVLYIYASSVLQLPDVVVPSQSATLIWLDGVANVTIQGLTIMHSANSYLGLHAAPGGGDWASAVEAAIRITDSINCSVVNNLLTQLAGNAIAVDGSSAATRIAFNELSYIGANAVSVRGTMLSWNASVERTQPSDTLIQSNLCHDVGKYNKQAGCLFHSLAYRTVLDGNVLHTTPRSAVNIQDGFGGGTVISHNVIVNSMTETVEGGPLNVWNRLPYWCPNVTDPDQPYTWEANPFYVHHNLMVVDNAGQEYFQAFNYDDGATAMHSHNNVVLRSRAGETNHGTQNFYCANLIFPPAGVSCWWVSTPTPLTVQADNTCIALQPAPTYGVDMFNNPCSADSLAAAYQTSSGNRYWLPYWAALNSSVVDAPFIDCGGATYSLPELQRLGFSVPGQREHSEQSSWVATGPVDYPYWRHIGPDWLSFHSSLCPEPVPEPSSREPSRRSDRAGSDTQTAAS